MSISTVEQIRNLALNLIVVLAVLSNLTKQSLVVLMESLSSLRKLANKVLGHTFLLDP